LRLSLAEVTRLTNPTAYLCFGSKRTTSPPFSGLILFQKRLVALDLRERLRQCFRHLIVSAVFGHGRIVMLLVVHFLLGYRQLREVRLYRDESIVARVLGMRRFPDVATLSRALAGHDERSVANLQCQGVLDCLAPSGLRKVTLDFDGSVIGTGRLAEGTAVGFNRKKKGQRSFTPWFRTVAQTAKVLGVWHRSGNVHDFQRCQGLHRPRRIGGP
jgi:hypothetical protein